MQQETAERLMLASALSQPVACALGTRAYVGPFSSVVGWTCLDLPQHWFEPGYGYPCGACFERRELLRQWWR